jgi:hypothetical protein
VLLIGSMGVAVWQRHLRATSKLHDEFGDLRSLAESSNINADLRHGRRPPALAADDLMRFCSILPRYNMAGVDAHVLPAQPESSNVQDVGNSGVDDLASSSGLDPAFRVESPAAAAFPLSFQTSRRTPRPALSGKSSGRVRTFPVLTSKMAVLDDSGSGSRCSGRGAVAGEPRPPPTRPKFLSRVIAHAECGTARMLDDGRKDTPRPLMDLTMGAPLSPQRLWQHDEEKQIELQEVFRSHVLSDDDTNTLSTPESSSGSRPLQVEAVPDPPPMAPLTPLPPAPRYSRRCSSAPPREPTVVPPLQLHKLPPPSQTTLQVAGGLGAPRRTSLLPTGIHRIAVPCDSAQPASWWPLFPSIESSAAPVAIKRFAPIGEAPSTSLPQVRPGSGAVALARQGSRQRPVAASRGTSRDRLAALYAGSGAAPTGSMNCASSGPRRVSPCAARRGAPPTPPQPLPLDRVAAAARTARAALAQQLFQPNPCPPYPSVRFPSLAGSSGRMSFVSDVISGPSVSGALLGTAGSHGTNRGRLFAGESSTAIQSISSDSTAVRDAISPCSISSPMLHTRPASKLAGLMPPHATDTLAGKRRSSGSGSESVLRGRQPHDTSSLLRQVDLRGMGVGFQELRSSSSGGRGRLVSGYQDPESGSPLWIGNTSGGRGVTEIGEGGGLPGCNACAGGVTPGRVEAQVLMTSATLTTLGTSDSLALLPGALLATSKKGVFTAGLSSYWHGGRSHAIALCQCMCHL